MESSAFGISFDLVSCHDLILALSTLVHPRPQHLGGHCQVLATCSTCGWRLTICHPGSWGAGFITDHSATEPVG